MSGHGRKEVSSKEDIKFRKILNFIETNILPYINDKSTQGQDLLNLFFTTFNKYVKEHPEIDFQIERSATEYAKDHKVPIMLPDGIDYLCNYIKENNIKRILEIGSAIGYSAIRMALCSLDIYVTTIEKDIDRYNIAVENINKYNLSSRINIILDDALNTEIEGEYDLIFIDASKGNNINFFKKYSHNLRSNGIIITDNLFFHGLVQDESLIKTKNQRGIVKKIKLFIEFLDNNIDFVTEYISVGDGISISIKKD